MNRSRDISFVSALLLVAAAALMGLGASANNGVYSGPALAYMLGAAGACASAVAIGAAFEFGGRSSSWIVALACVGIAIFAMFDHPELLGRPRADHAPLYAEAAAMLAGLTLRGRWRWLAVGGMLAVAGIFGLFAIWQYPQPQMDVLDFQQRASAALLHGQNPYAMRFVSVYNDQGNRLYYGPNVVRDGVVQYGFPYPPLSLLMSLPGYVLGGDCRYSNLAAILLSALLMASARRWPSGYGAAAILLFLQSSQYVLRMSYTEPFVLLCFSLALWCACRWKPGVPIALGLVLASKQYCVIFLPAILLLPCDDAKRWRTLTIAIGVAVLITAPLALWNFHEFWRATVRWQLVQPFRTDAISVLAYLVRQRGWPVPPIWIPLLALVPALGLIWLRGLRTPAGFAAACALLMIAFLLFNKQAFANYYYLVTGMVCWAIAARGLNPS